MTDLTDIKNPTPAPTTDDLVDALAIRDEIATRIAQTDGVAIPSDFAKKAAERLIKCDLVNLTVAYRNSRRNGEGVEEADDFDDFDD